MPPRKPTSPRARRLRRTLACAVSISGIMLTTAGPGHADPYAPPVPVPDLAPSTLDVRYAAERGAIEKALGTAREVGDTDRVRALGAFLRPGRRFLHFDPRGGGHSDYLAPGSTSLRNLTGIALGRVSDVTPG